MRSRIGIELRTRIKLGAGLKLWAGIRLRISTSLREGMIFELGTKLRAEC